MQQKVNLAILSYTLHIGCHGVANLQLTIKLIVIQHSVKQIVNDCLIANFSMFIHECRNFFSKKIFRHLVAQELFYLGRRHYSL